MAPHCFTCPWIRDNEETSGRSKNLSKVKIKKIGYSVKDELWGQWPIPGWLAPSACLRVSDQLCDRFGHVASVWGYGERICSGEKGQQRSSVQEPSGVPVLHPVSGDPDAGGAALHEHPKGTQPNESSSQLDGSFNPGTSPGGQVSG